MRTVLTLLTLLIAPTFAHAAAEVGRQAPDFGASNSYGEDFYLSDHLGKYVVLEWTNHLCPFVKKHYETGNMQTLQKELTAKGVVWVSVISSAPSKQGHVDGLKANELTLKRDAKPSHILLDDTGTIGKLYGARTTPQIFIVDPDGKVAYAGAIDSINSTKKSDVKKADNYIRMAFANLEAGTPVAVASTAPYGCSVKY